VTIVHLMPIRAGKPDTRVIEARNCHNPMAPDLSVCGAYLTMGRSTNRCPVCSSPRPARRTSSNGCACSGQPGTAYVCSRHHQTRSASRGSRQAGDRGVHLRLRGRLARSLSRRQRRRADGAPRAPDPWRDDVLPVVRCAAERRLATTPDYWDHATVLEWAVLGGGEAAARQPLEHALAATRETLEPTSMLQRVRRRRCRSSAPRHG
jgi:hypothetical protein